MLKAVLCINVPLVSDERYRCNNKTLGITRIQSLWLRDLLNISSTNPMPLINVYMEGL